MIVSWYDCVALYDHLSSRFISVYLQVLDEGVIVEFDSAQSLLSTPNTHFAGLVAQTEPTEAEYLRTLAHCSDK